MQNDLSTFIYFLEGYLALEPNADIDEALRLFAKEEDTNKVSAFRHELEELLDPSVNSEKLGVAINALNRYVLKSKIPPILVLARLFDRSQRVGPPEPYRRPFDAFISHSHSDATKAKILASELDRAGFKVWLDDREILAGHDIVEEVFRGIGSSDFLLILLSKASTASSWVQKEINAAFINEIDRQQIVVIPVLLEKCEIPEKLKSKKYADLTTSWEAGVRYILASMEGYRSSRGLRGVGREIPTEGQTSKLMSFYKKVVEDINSKGWPIKESFKDVAIGQLDQEVIRFPKEKLRETIRLCRVGLQNWGGASFPYDEMPNAVISPLSNGIRLIDQEPWPYSDWSFYYWRFQEDAFFAQRSYLYEDHSSNLKGTEPILCITNLRDR